MISRKEMYSDKARYLRKIILLLPATYQILGKTTIRSSNRCRIIAKTSSIHPLTYHHPILFLGGWGGTHPATQPQANLGLHCSMAKKRRFLRDFGVKMHEKEGGSVMYWLRGVMEVFCPQSGHLEASEIAHPTQIRGWVAVLSHEVERERVEVERVGVVRERGITTINSIFFFLDLLLLHPPI